MPPLGMSEDQSDWVEGSIPELRGFFQTIQTAAGQRGVIVWYADNVMIEGEMSPGSHEVDRRTIARHAAAHGGPSAR